MSRVRQVRLVVEAADSKVRILDVGRATLEISNPAQVAMIDEVEVGRRAEPVAPPTPTPWRSLNARLAAPAGRQITVFQELD